MKYLLIDIGGTFIKWSIAKKDGTLLVVDKFKTPNTNNELLENIDELITLHSPDEIAFSSPGCIDEENDNIGGVSAIEYIHDFKYKEYFNNKYKIDISIANDANCALYAELWKGAASEYKDVISIVIGTGIGGAISINKEIINGCNNFAGEFGLGQVLVNGELTRTSQICSTHNMVLECSNYLGNEINGEDIMNLYLENKEVKKIVDKFVMNVAVLIFNLNVTINPEVFVVGGGISSNDLYIKILNEKIIELSKKELDAPIVNIKVCEFKNNANLVGALYYHLSKNLVPM